MLAMAAAIVPLASPAQACYPGSSLITPLAASDRASSPLAFHFPAPPCLASPLGRSSFTAPKVAWRTRRVKSASGASLHSNTLLMQEDSGIMMENWKLALEKAAEKWRYRQRETFVDNELYEREWVTPLWMITQEPDLNNLVKYLQEMRLKINDAPDQVHVIQFSRAQIEAAREAFSRMVGIFAVRLYRSRSSGEERRDEAAQAVRVDRERDLQHQLLPAGCCRRPAQRYSFTSSRFHVDASGSVGPKGQGQRFQLVQPLSAEELYAQTDLDLGSRQVRNISSASSSRSLCSSRGSCGKTRSTRGQKLHLLPILLSTKHYKYT